MSLRVNLRCFRSSGLLTTALGLGLLGCGSGASERASDGHTANDSGEANPNGNGGAPMGAGGRVSGGGGFPAGGADGLSGGPGDGETGGAGPLPTTNHQSGSRIRIRFLVTPEGNKSWEGWYDSERDEPCRFLNAADGTPRCFPLNTTATVQFTDAACTQPVAVVDPCQELEFPVRYAFRYSGTQCVRTLALHALGDAVATPAEVFVRNTAGACGPSTPGQGRYYVIGAELDQTSFQAGEYQILDTPSRIDTDAIVTSDGARSVRGWQDSDLDVGCNWDGGNPARCSPSTSGVQAFADATCSDPLIRRRQNPCATQPPAFASEYDVVTCTSSYYRVGERFSATAYVEGEAGCAAAIPEDPPMEHYRLGEPLGPDPFVTATLEADLATTTRLVPLHRTTADGGSWFSHWYDQALEVECDFTTFESGERYCVPRADDASPFYTDAACTEAVFEFFPRTLCGVARVAPTWHRSTTYDPVCSLPTIETRRVLAAREVTALYRLIGGTCSVRTVNADAQYLSLGPPLALSEFVSGTLRVE